nr:hypothetical protein [uncultured Rhodoferax sp.]
MIPVLLCTYRPTYLNATLGWLKTPDFDKRFRLFVWDNGGAEATLRQFGLEWQCSRDETTGKVWNLGKALAMRHLIDSATAALPEADVFVCMDDDIAVDAAHLDAIVSAARRPGVGMVAGQMHPFNSLAPVGGTITLMDACPSCANVTSWKSLFSRCPRCKGTGMNTDGLRLKTYPVETRTIHGKGQVAGGLFAVSRVSLSKLSWAPYLYPFLGDDSNEPVLYWTEDASLDHGLTSAGLINGYLDSSDVNPAIHLPGLNPEYERWKEKAREAPLTTPAFSDRLT